MSKHTSIMQRNRIRELFASLMIAARDGFYLASPLMIHIIILTSDNHKLINTPASQEDTTQTLTPCILQRVFTLKRKNLNRRHCISI